ncbi:MAG: hypothetical protein IT381_25160 [Deltaproteobacteria bacterium]|nr:hypothetical protein [Deltaproteobacteria bacterium]
MTLDDGDCDGHAAFDVCALLEEPACAPAKNESHVLGWRYDGEVFFRAPTADEHAALTRLARGETFGDACEALSAMHETAAVAQVMLGFLNRRPNDGRRSLPLFV